MCVCVCLFSELVSITRLRANNYIHEIQEIAKLLCMCVCVCSAGLCVIKSCM